jgi:hypothetical protein
MTPKRELWSGVVWLTKENWLLQHEVQGIDVSRFAGYLSSMQHVSDAVGRTSGGSLRNLDDWRAFRLSQITQFFPHNQEATKNQRQRSTL